MQIIELCIHIILQKVRPKKNKPLWNYNYGGRQNVLNPCVLLLVCEEEVIQLGLNYIITFNAMYIIA
jgi:hypothetical protein